MGMRNESTVRMLGAGIDDPCAPQAQLWDVWSPRPFKVYSLRDRCFTFHCLGNSVSVRSRVHLNEINTDAVAEMGSQWLALTTGETSRADRSGLRLGLAIDSKNGKAPRIWYRN